MENYCLFTTEICWDHLSIHLSNRSFMLLTQHVTPVKTGLLQWDSKLLVATMNKLNNLPSKHSSMHMVSQSRCCTITSWTNIACRSISPCLKSTLQVSHNKESFENFWLYVHNKQELQVNALKIEFVRSLGDYYFNSETNTAYTNCLSTWWQNLNQLDAGSYLTKTGLLRKPTYAFISIDNNHHVTQTRNFAEHKMIVDLLLLILWI